MHEQLIAAVVEEIGPELRGRLFGKVWLLGRDRLAADFRLSENRFLFVSLDPSAPRLHLVGRRVRDLEKQSLPPSSFALTLRKQLGGAVLRSLAKDEGERVVRFSFAAQDAAGSAHARTLIAQLTGRTANLFLLDEDARVIDTLRPARGEGQEAGETYQPPQRGPRALAASDPPQFERGPHDSLSAALDEHFGRLEAARAFDARVSTHRARLRREIERRRKLERNLAADMSAHGDADAHKRAGDLLLANIATAVRAGGRVRLTDYFAEDAPTIEIEIDEHATFQEEAARRFALYTRAKRAAQEVARRREELRSELVPLEARLAEIELIAAARDEASLADFDGRAAGGKKDFGRANKAAARHVGGASESVKTSAGGKAKAAGGRGAAASFSGARRYLSTDGYEILVGRAARDNDQLTFKVARSHDLWLHAADYPGSHVVVRNRARGADIPQRTVHEAAQLAAYFSQAKRDSKVAVNYALRKFVSKPKGAAHGLVRLSSFRTLLVEPREGVERVG